MDELGVTRFTLKILVLIGVAMLFDGFDYMVVSYTMPQISAEWGLDGVQSGSLASWSMLGLVVGGAASGMIADRVGRKKTLMGGTLLYSLVSALTFFAPGYDAFVICRLLTGVGLGACIPMANTINSEYAPTRVRGLFVALGLAFMIVGQMLAGVFALVVIPAFGWRVTYLLGGIPICYVIVLRFALPESALWLVARGRKQEALVIVAEMERSAGVPPRPRTPDDLICPPPMTSRGVGALFGRRYWKMTVGLWVNAFFIAAVMYGVNAWTPSMLMESGFEMAQSYGYTIAQNAAALLATCLAGVMIEKVGRIRGAFAAVALALVSCGVMALVLQCAHGAVLLGCILLGFSVNFAITCPKSLTPELYPTELRGTAIALTAAVGRIGGFLAPLAFGLAVGAGWSFAQLSLTLMVPLALSGAALLLCVGHETMGVSLEEMQRRMGE